MNSERVLLERDGDLAILTLNRPEVHNAIDLAMVNAMHAALEGLEKDLPGALVLTGAGDRAFAAGADIEQVLHRGAAEGLQAINSRLFRRVEEIACPTIAAVRGFALGGGCELALACDLRVCGESARFGQPEVGLGIIPGAGGTQRLPRLIGLSRAKEMILTGRMIDANEAERIGLVHRVAPDAEVLEAARSLAMEILRQGPMALRLAKQALNSAFPGMEAGLAFETASQAVLYASEDKRARMTRFLERRRTKESK